MLLIVGVHRMRMEELDQLTRRRISGVITYDPCHSERVGRNLCRVKEGDARNEFPPPQRNGRIRVHVEVPPAFLPDLLRNFVVHRCGCEQCHAAEFGGTEQRYRLLLAERMANEGEVWHWCPGRRCAA